MFSSITMASSTTKPTAMVSAISDRLSRLKPSTYITAAGAEQRERHRDARNDGRPGVAQEQEDHHHDQRDGEHQRELDVAHRGLDGGGAIGDCVDLDRRRHGSSDAAAASWTRCTASMTLAPGCLKISSCTLCAVLRPAGLIAVLRAIDRDADVADAHRRAVLVGDHDVVPGLGALSTDRCRRSSGCASGR